MSLIVLRLVILKRLIVLFTGTKHGHEKPSEHKADENPDYPHNSARIKVITTKAGAQPILSV